MAIKTNMTVEVNGKVYEAYPYTKFDCVTDISGETLQKRYNDLLTDIAVERARIDGFKVLTNGSTTGDAELTDIRVKADGTTAATAGDAVREQVGELKETLDELTIPDCDWNLHSYTRSTDGVIVLYTPTSTSDYDSIEVNCKNFGKVSFNKSYSSNAGYAFLDENGVYISGGKLTDDTDVVKYGVITKNIPSNAVTFRTTRLTDNTGLHESNIKLYLTTNAVNNLGSDNTMITDKTLLLEDVPADAKAVGVALSNISKINTDNYDLYKIFHHVGIIADSIGSGECIYTVDGVAKYDADLYEHSWGQYMARDSGNAYYNFSRGGQTTSGWMTDNERGYGLASDSNHACEAYIIGLGQNDIPLINKGILSIGTTDDIDLSNPDANVNSFIGNYGKIISKMKELCPKAKFFLLTNPLNSKVNDAIRSIVPLFNNCYLLDLQTKSSDYKTGLLAECYRTGHYNAIGYRIMAKLMEDNISDYIYNNPAEFMQVEFINTDYSYEV